MVFNTLVGRAIIGRELAKRQGITDPAEQLRLGLIGGLIGSPTIGLVATTAIARQQASRDPQNPPTPGDGPGDGPTTVNEVKVPDVSDEGSFEAAKQVLESAGLKAKEVGVHSADDPAGKIVGQVPEADTFVPKSSTVEVKVSRGPVTPSQGTMPLVKGLSLEAAKKAVLTAGGGSLSEKDISIVAGFDRDGASSDSVIMQNPDPGSTITAETRPTLMVAIAVTVTVPSVVDLPVGEAKQAIAKARLTPVVEGEIFEDPNLVVIDQSPQADAQVPIFSEVTLRVTVKSPEPIPG